MTIKTIGILGSGQLGKMLALVAKQMGYRVHVFSPGTDTPTGQVADLEISAAYLDLDAVAAFAQAVDVITYEFENVPLDTAQTAAQFAPLYPSETVLAVAQNRILEKGTLAEAGLPVTPHWPVKTEEDLQQALTQSGVPCVLKTAESGYDGKGQVRIDHVADGLAAWEKIGRKPAVLEAWINYDCEISVVGARGQDGTFTHYGAIQNEHRNHILDISTAPANIPDTIAQRAIETTKTIFETLDVVGVLCVEFFVLLSPTASSPILINEIAPRPHNSGHLTIEGCVTSQFEQQLRAICGLPLGSTAFHNPTVMLNLLGDLWQNGEPNWGQALALPNVHLHLYGKAAARKGRKMGHLTITGDSIGSARETALAAKEALL